MFYKLVVFIFIFFSSEIVYSQLLLKEEIKKDTGIDVTKDATNKYNKNGLKEGLWVISCGSHTDYDGYTIGQFLDDRKEGKWLYYKNNKLYYEINYLNGNKHGLLYDYDTNGKLIRILNFKEGKLHGEGKFFDGNGMLLAILRYEENEYKETIFTLDDKVLNRINIYFNDYSSCVN